MVEVSGKLQENADIGKTTWFRVGGMAELLFKPQDEADLCTFLKNKPSEMPVTVIGAGSNIIVSDSGVRGVVIKLGRNFASISHDGNILQVGAGALDFTVAMYCLEHGLTGLEYLSGIPGSIGGNIPSNAGAYGHEIRDFIIKAEAINKAGEKLLLSKEELGLSYRKCSYLDKNPDTIFTKAWFKIEAGDKTKIKERIEQIKEDRHLSQPVKARTGGSTFKNPEGHKAWRLIDKVGLRGHKIGDAQISDKHCNFLINNGQAKAADLIALGRLAKDKVKAETGIELEWEIKVIGDE